jgi:Tol biopolymer transport system component
MVLPGARLGPYEILSLIGSGGMGEVYRARDTKLSREVALKILPPAFAGDPDRLARFRREAQVLASLNHPNIASIYGFEDSGSTHALVLELVEGPTLADQIAKGAIPIDDALPIARQIAEALEAAHEQGIVHRDLKPANIKLRNDGTVKVLDFGLAKALESAPGLRTNPANSPTITSPAMMTGVGMILGTAAYMAPEQAKGRPADKRSDIWAFGCVLFEMLTGERAFAGEDVADTLTTVLKGEPDWGTLPVDTPTPIRTLLTRCLQKDAKRRLPSIAVAQLDIDDALASPHPAIAGAVARTPPRWRERLAWSLVGVSIAIASGIAIVRYTTRPIGDTRVMRFTMSPPAGWTLVRAPNEFRISPDGRRIVFPATEAAGRTVLWLRALDSLTSQELPGTEGASTPFWSPDSRHVAFRAGGKLKKIDVSGGQPITLCDAPDFRGGTWSQQGIILFGSQGGLRRIPDSGGVPALVDIGRGTPTLVSFLPDGRHYLYRTFAGVFVASLDSADQRQLFPENGPANVEYADGHVLFERDGTLMAQPFDPRRLTVGGEPVPIAETVQTFAAGLPVGLFSASANGVLVYEPGANAPESQLAWFDRQGTQLATVGDPADYADVALSPDSKRAAVTIPDPRQRTRNVWILDTVRGLRAQFTFDPAEDLAPAWAPDGTRIAFSSRRRGRWGIYQKAANGAGVEEPIVEFPPDSLVANPLSWSADNRFVLFVQGNASAAMLSMLPLADDRKPLVLLSAGAAGPGQLSPDNHWISYFSNESGRQEVYVMPYPNRGGKRLVSTSGGTQPRWRSDGKEIFYISPDSKIMAAEVKAEGDVFEVGAVRPLFAIHGVQTRWAYDVSRDGQRFLVNARLEDRSPASPLTVVVNWPATLEH